MIINVVPRETADKKDGQNEKVVYEDGLMCVCAVMDVSVPQYLCTYQDQ